jgi:hypothetical protein
MKKYQVYKNFSVIYTVNAKSEEQAEDLIRMGKGKLYSEINDFTVDVYESEEE